MLRQFAPALAILGLLCSVIARDAPAKAFYDPNGDIPAQKNALIALYDAVGAKSLLSDPGTALQVAGLPGNVTWKTPNVSYCSWWGVQCCGDTLSSLVHICEHGVNSVNALQLGGMELFGTLPDIFGDLPDLQYFHVSGNIGLQGQLPPSLGKLNFLWMIAAYNTRLHCNATPPEPVCPLPPWLQFTDTFYYIGDGIECPDIQFVTPRQKQDTLKRVYQGLTHAQVWLPETYYFTEQCVHGLPGESMIAQEETGGLPFGALVVVVLVPSLAVTIGLVLLAAALMRYLRYLKSSHDAIHLTETWKRRHVPGIIVDGNNRVLREVTMVITDVEGSTELMEWDHDVMTCAQEIHDNVMRKAISKFCGYEVTTEGDSFTIAFHDAFDAVSWAMATQRALLEADWPPELLLHEKAAEVVSSSEDSTRPNQLLFKGLRVRMAINTGIPTVIQPHDLTNTLMYEGPVMDLAAALSDLPAGGQVLLSPTTFGSIASRLPELGLRIMLSGVGEGPEANVGDLLHTSPTYARLSLNHMDTVAASLGSQALAPPKPWYARVWPLSRGSTSQASSAASGPERSNRGGRPGGRGRPQRQNGSLREEMDVLSGMEAGITRRGSAGSIREAGAPHQVNDLVLQEQEYVPLVIDMGSHWVEGTLAAGNLSNPSALVGKRLTQIVERALSPRAAHFPSLKTNHQVYPSYFEAPAAASALLPDGLAFTTGDQPIVTMAFVAPDGMRAVEAISSLAAKQALDMFCSVVRTTVTACGGYECQEKDGIFMLAFGCASDALEWACILQLALMRVHWAPDVLACGAGIEVLSPSGELMFRGMRARVGIYRGRMTRIIPHP